MSESQKTRRMALFWVVGVIWLLSGSLIPGLFKNNTPCENKQRTIRV